jgi:hypothetical protein
MSKKTEFFWKERELTKKRSFFSYGRIEGGRPFFSCSLSFQKTSFFGQLRFWIGGWDRQKKGKPYHMIGIREEDKKKERHTEPEAPSLIIRSLRRRLLSKIVDFGRGRGLIKLLG